MGQLNLKNHHQLRILLIGLITTFYILTPSYCYGVVVIDEVRYNLNYDEGTASIINSPIEKENLVIPDFIIVNDNKYPVTRIEDNAFTYANLKGTLTIGNNITSIGGSAFLGNKFLTGSLTIPNSVENIDLSAFQNCSGFNETLELSNNLTAIGSNVFEGCSGLKAVNFPNSITHIGNRAFANCSGLESLSLPNSLAIIGPEAFYKCSGIKGDLIIPNSVISISYSAFEDCLNIESLQIGNSLLDIDSYTFKNCIGLKGSLTIPNSVRNIYTGAFSGCTGLRGTLTIGNSVKNIYYEAFYNCRFTGSLEIPNSVTSIGYRAFYNCYNFSGSLEIPGSVTTIGGEAFRYTGFDGSLIIDDGLTTIGNFAFSNTTFEEITLPASLKDLGDGAFNNINGPDPKIKKITCNALIPPECNDEIYHPAFDYHYYSQPLYVPHESIEEYKTAKIWKNFFDIRGIGETQAESIVLDKAHAEMYVTETMLLSATIFPEYITERSIFWSSSDESIATVDNTGLVTAVAVGETIISATCDNVSATCKITVNPVTVSTVTLNVSKMTLFIGQTDKLTATVSPENVTDKTITWTSDNEEIATVSEDGTVTAVAAGVANITATCGDVSASCKVTVNPVNAASVSLNVSEMTLLIGQTDKLTATVSPENVTDKTITWTSDNEPIASVNEDGTVTALTLGVANITATCGDVSATCKVTVNPVTASTVTLNVSDMTLLVGQSDKLTATVAPENVTDKTITWTSDNEEIATVSEDGTVTAITVGVANITSTCGDVSATCKVTVNSVTASTITLNISEITLFIGQSDKLTATVSPENVTDKDITWTSDKAQIAIVSQDGTVTGLAVGVANITAKCGDVSATCKVTVNPVTASTVMLNASDMTLFIGQTDKLTATISPENVTNKTIIWTSDNEEVATVSEDGTVTAVAAGVANITASCGDVSATCKVTVNPVTVSTVTLNVSGMTLFIGQTDKLIATVLPENVTDNKIIWTSDNEQIATVSEDGTVTAITVGVANITATCGDVSATCKVTVNSVTASTVTLNVSDMTLFIGQTDKLTATISPENVTDKTITWTSDNEQIAIVSQDGTVTAVAVGVANITASCSDVSATCKVTVNPITAFTLTLNVSEMTLPIGQTDKLTATVSPENVTDKSIIWTSDNEMVATVSPDGTVTAVSAGVANISASCGDVSATCKVTVIEIDRPETPKEFVKKGDGKSCTFVVMMNLSDSELAKKDYNFVYGYTDTQDTDHIITSSPLRYCHTTPEIFNDFNNDFWVYSYRYDSDGEIVMSGRRHLDGHVDYENDSVLLNEYLTRSFTSSDPDSWITPTSRGARIQIASSNSSLLTIHTLSGTLVYSDTFNSGKRVDMEISADRFVADVYVVTIQSGEIRTSKKIIIR